MRNVRKGSEGRKIVQATKKGIKKQKDLIGNSLMKKLEPLLSIPRKTGKFQSPYKSLQKVKTTSKDNGNQGPTTTSFPNQQLNIAAQTSKTLITQTGNKLGEERSEDLVNAKVLPNLPKASPVKIQPIDPYQFCEPFLTDCLKSTVPQKDTMFKRSKEAQSKVNREILTLIKRTAEAIKQIRSQHEEWKRINIKVKN